MKNGLNKVLLVVSKTMEIIHWVGAGIGALVAIIAGIDKSFITNDLLADGKTFTSYGLEVNAITQTGEINFFAVTMIFVSMIFTMSLMALVFRNLYLILKTITGKNKHAESTSPFQKDIVRRVRELGIFTMAIPVIGIIFQIIINTVSVINGMSVESFVSVDGFIIGLICICLSQIFSYGTKLEEEVDGLV